MTETEMSIVSDVLANAENEGLIVEVVTSALRWMKENPDSTVGTAIQMGEHEWIK